MKEFYKNYLQSNLFFWIFSAIGILMMVVAFFIPPTAHIDSSILVAVGEINGFIALGTVLKAVDKGSSASIKHKDTELIINKKEGDE